MGLTRHGSRTCKYYQYTYMVDVIIYLFETYILYLLFFSTQNVRVYNRFEAIK